MARIAIVGPGAIGGVTAAWLAQTGRHEVTLCSRRPLNGLTVETPGRVLRVRPAVLTDPRKAAAVDWVLVATKAYDAEGASAWFAGLAREGAPVAILQNGVEHRERFARYLPPEQIVPVVVDIPSERMEPERIQQRGPATMVVDNDDRGREFLALFSGTSIEVSTTSDFKTAMWRKLCFNSAGAISAILLQPAGVLRGEEIGEIAREIVRECIVVGRAEGAVLPDSLVESVLAGYRKAPPDSLNSLHADRLAGRPMEIDARNGAIVRFGRKHSIKTPCNQMAVALLSALTDPC